MLEKLYRACLWLPVGLKVYLHGDSPEKSKVHEGFGETYVWCMTPVTSGTNGKPMWKFPRATQNMQRKMGEKAQEAHLVPI